MSETENQSNYAPPPPPPAAPAPPPAAAGPVMSTPETLSGIFFEPGLTFEALRARPRFLVAALIMVAVFVIWNAVFFSKVDYNEMIREAIMTSPQTESLTAEQKEQQISIQTNPIVKAFAYASPLIFIPLFLAVGGAIYLLGAMAMGKKVSYKQALAIWTYSSLPPLLIVMLANIVLVLVRPPDVAAAAAASRGMVHANPSILIDKVAHPVLATALGAFDLFACYGLALAATGMRKVARMSSGSAWAIVVGLYLLGLLFKLGFAAISGTPVA